MAHTAPSDELRFGATIFRSIASCLFVLFMLFACTCYYCMESLPVAQWKMDSIRFGMTQEDVRAVLGPPWLVYSDESGQGSQWKYGHESQWQMFEVTFDRNGLVSDTHLDR
jgi:outer membrane protein assembly factor BamE (lipoprotein component of BamABCDE complex)